MLPAQGLPSDGRISGQVFDEVEQPVRAAKVTFFDDARNMLGTTLSDGTGWFLSKGLSLRCEAILVVVEAKGFARHESQVKLRWFDPESAIRVRLRSADTVRGRVRSKDGAAIAGATVLVGSGRTWTQEPPASAVTDADGKFTLHGVPLGSGTLVGIAEGFIMNELPIVTPCAQLAQIELTPGAGRTLAARVVGVDDEQARTLWLTRGLYTSLGTIALGTRQLSGANDSIRGVPDEWRSYATLAGRDPHGRDGFVIGNSTPNGDTLTATVPAPGEMTGTVVDAAGKPVPGLGLKARNGELFASLTITDEQGRFRMRRPAAANATVEMFTLSHGYVLRGTHHGEHDIRNTWGIAQVSTDAPIRVVAERAPVLRGKLVDSDGVPVPAFAVALTTTDANNRVWSNTTDRDGSFEFGRWAIAGIDVTLQVGELPGAVTEGPFNLQAGEVKTVEVRLPKVQAHTFEVRSATNQPVPGAALQTAPDMSTRYYTNREGRCVVSCCGHIQPLVVADDGRNPDATIEAQGNVWIVRLR